QIEYGGSTVYVFDGEGARIGQFVFDDGSSYTPTELAEVANGVATYTPGGTGSVYFAPSATNYVLQGGAGNDTISSWADYATARAGDGDTTIVTRGDFAILVGGDGNDTLT